MQFRNTLTRISQLIVDVLQTAEAPLARWVLKSPTVTSDTLEAFTGSASETVPATLSVEEVSGEGFLRFEGPQGWGGVGEAFLELHSGNAGAAASAILSGESITIDLAGGAGQLAGVGDDWTLSADTFSLQSTTTTSKLDLNTLGVWTFTGFVQAVLVAQFGLFGTTISELAFTGDQALTTNASGQLVITHGLTAAPTFVVPILRSGAGTLALRTLVSTGATTYVYQVVNTTTGAAAPAATALTVRSFAIR